MQLRDSEPFTPNLMLAKAQPLKLAKIMLFFYRLLGHVIE